MIEYPNSSKLSILLLILIIPFTEGCDSSINTMGCQFIVKSNSPDCTTFEFHSCQWQICDQDFTDIDNNNQCSHYVTVTKNSWENCMDTCCKESSNAQQKYETLNNCYEKNTNKAILVSSILGGVSGLVVIIVFACCCRENIKQCCGSICQCIGNRCSGLVECFRNCCNGFNYVNRDQGSQEQLYGLQIAGVPQQVQLMEKRFWMDCEEQFNNKDESCAICLDNITSVRLECKHVYHRNCILDWISRRARCPLCNKQINNMTMYCKKCMRKKREITLNASRRKLSLFAQYCQNCA